MAETLMLLLGGLVGLVLGLTGAGGSVIAVPLLMVGVGWTLPQAVPVALLAVALSALVGALSAARQRLLCYRAAFLMIALGLITAPAGIYLGQWLPHFWLQLLFAIVLLIVAGRMLSQAIRSPADSSVSVPPSPGRRAIPSAGSTRIPASCPGRRLVLRPCP